MEVTFHNQRKSKLVVYEYIAMSKPGKLVLIPFQDSVQISHIWHINVHGLQNKGLQTTSLCSQVLLIHGYSIFHFSLGPIRMICSKN